MSAFRPFLPPKRKLLLLAVPAILAACAPTSDRTREDLRALLEDGRLSDASRYAVVNQISGDYLAHGQYNELVLFLTGRVEENPDDIYNAYWLLMTAYAYLESGAEPMAEYYFERTLRNCGDLIVKGTSVHLLCLSNLIRISRNPANRIYYFNQLINRFPAEVSTTELYWRTAMEYEAAGEWDKALKSFQQFLNCEDSTTIRIAGAPDAYATARQLIDFSNSSRDWTFESLDALADAVKSAISRYDWRALERCRSKVNFFAMSWGADDTAAGVQDDFSVRGYMLGNKIQCDASFDRLTNENEAYLKTSGWSPYLPIWYLYFRKVNFPADPEIHGRWEWAGIYYGEKL